MYGQTRRLSYNRYFSSSFACRCCTVIVWANPCQTHVGPYQTHTIWMESVSRGYSMGVAWALHEHCMGCVWCVCRACMHNCLNISGKTSGLMLVASGCNQLLCMYLAWVCLVVCAARSFHKKSHVPTLCVAAPSP